MILMLELPNHAIYIIFSAFFLFSIMTIPRENSHTFNIFCVGKNGEKEVTLFMGVLSMQRGELLELDL